MESYRMAANSPETDRKEANLKVLYAWTSGSYANPGDPFLSIFYKIDKFL